jgi:hypothetical protein
MQYFYRSHATPEAVLGFAKDFFPGRGLPGNVSGDEAAFSDTRGTIQVHVEIEGGHYTRVTVGTSDVGESEIDKVAKRFLAELHTLDEPSHVVRGAY